MEPWEKRHNLLAARKAEKAARDLLDIATELRRCQDKGSRDIEITIGFVVAYLARFKAVNAKQIPTLALGDHDRSMRQFLPLKDFVQLTDTNERTARHLCKTKRLQACKDDRGRWWVCVGEITASHEEFMVDRCPGYWAARLARAA